MRAIRGHADGSNASVMLCALLDRIEVGDAVVEILFGATERAVGRPCGELGEDIGGLAR